jgi:hypothetical protein
MSGMFSELKKLDDKKRSSRKGLLTDELKGGPANSPFLKAQQDSRSSIDVGKTAIRHTNAQNGPKRIWRRRQAFDVFEDQYQALKRFAEEEQARGLPGSMSKMVRDALDNYIKEHASKS